MKERLRMLLACTDLDTARGLLGITVMAADLREAWRLRETINDCTSSAPDAATATTGTTWPVSCYAATGRHAGGAHA